MEQGSEQRGASDVLVRPTPVQPLTERVRAWISWFGLGRMIAAAVSTVVVCVGAFWLVRTPPPPAEAVVPRVSVSEQPAATLAPPSSGPGGEATAALPIEPATVIVHVAGAVTEPGVYQLANGERVDDAVRVAGGGTGDADLDALNLAAPLIDGARIYVPVEGEVVSASPEPVTAPNVLEPAGPVNVNTANAEQLEALPGVGPATAAAIVAERERNGPFLGVDELERVPGIGPAKLAGLRDSVTA